MKLKSLFLITLLAGAALSCSKDDPNQVPDFDPNQTFTVAEDKVPGDNLGTVQANDPDDDPLTFSIITNDNNLFAIGESTGVLTLANGMSMDFETATSHSITVSATDGTNTVDAQVIINVENVIDLPLAVEEGSFVTKWEIAEDDEDKTITIETDSNLSYDYLIDWGDGSKLQQVSTGVSQSHSYSAAGVYTIGIHGNFPRIIMLNNSDSAEKLISIEKWGAIPWTSFKDAFGYCENMIYNATDIPDLSKVTNLSGMFGGAYVFNGDISNWDVSKIVNMQAMFAGAIAFNQDLSSWETNKVTNMTAMFLEASEFDSNISNWNVELVEDMSGMFLGASGFDHDLGSWDIRNVTSMEEMLDGSGLTDENYEKTLIGWAGQENVPSEITLGANGLRACSDEGLDAVGILENDKDWTIEDDGCSM